MSSLREGDFGHESLPCEDWAGRDESYRKMEEEAGLTKPWLGKTLRLGEVGEARKGPPSGTAEERWSWQPLFQLLSYKTKSVVGLRNPCCDTWPQQFGDGDLL